MTDETHSNDHINVGDISGSSGVAVGPGASAQVDIHHYPPPEFPLDNLPPANPNFVGRLEKLTAIQTAFQNPKSPVAITLAIAGLGGVGKTQLALAYAHDQRDAYDLIWLLRADDPATLDGDLRQLGAALRLPVQNVDAPTARQLVLSWLNGGHARWLMLYDNADALTPGELRPYLPGGAGRVLITTRQARWPGAQTLRLGVFAAEEAAAFWQRRLPQRFVKSGRFDKSWAELAEELGRLPLALEQAAAYMAARQKSAADYLRLYRQRRQELWARAKAPDDYHATVTTTWEMAFAYARQTPGAADLLNLCCFLAPEEIPLELITAHAAALPEELADVLADELKRDDALEALTAYSLMTKENDMLTIHRLVQTVARDRMGEKRAKIWAEAAVELVYQALPDWKKLHEWEAGRAFLPHMIAAADLAQEQGIESERLADLDNWLGYYLQYTGSYEEAQPYYEQALAIRQNVLGPDHPDTASSLNNMGGLLQAMGELAAARPYYEQALAIKQKVLGPNHPDTALSLNNLGSLLQAMGELAAARPYYEQALTIRQKVLGPDHPDTALSLNNMGGLLQAMEELAAARPYVEQALAIRQKVLGPDHPDTATSLNNMGSLLQAMGELAAARPYFEQALAIFEAKLGMDHPYTKIARNNLQSL